MTPGEIIDLKEKLHSAIEALQWCSGADDFAPGGKARAGFEKVVLPILAWGLGDAEVGRMVRNQVVLKEEDSMAPMTEACQANKVGSVSNALHRVDNGIGRLRAAIEALEKRLTPILGSPRVSPKSTDELKKSSVPLADKVDNIANLIEGAVTRVEDLMDRVEL